MYENEDRRGQLLTTLIVVGYDYYLSCYSPVCFDDLNMDPIFDSRKFLVLVCIEELRTTHLHHPQRYLK